LGNHGYGSRSKRRPMMQLQSSSLIQVVTIRITVERSAQSSSRNGAIALRTPSTFLRVCSFTVGRVSRTRRSLVEHLIVVKHGMGLPVGHEKLKMSLALIGLQARMKGVEVIFSMYSSNYKPTRLHDLPHVLPTGNDHSVAVSPLLRCLPRRRSANALRDRLVVVLDH